MTAWVGHKPKALSGSLPDKVVIVIVVVTVVVIVFFVVVYSFDDDNYAWQGVDDPFCLLWKVHRCEIQNMVMIAMMECY